MLTLGCGQGSGDASVVGKVTLDGFPLEAGKVVFSSVSSNNSASSATGKIDAQGNYQLVIGRSSGLSSGEYTARVIAMGPAIEQPDGAPPVPGELLTPAKYAKAETSGLRYRLRPGKNVIDIALASDPEPAAEEEAAEMEPAEEAEETSDEAEPAAELEMAAEATESEEPPAEEQVVEAVEEVQDAPAEAVEKAAE